MIPRPQRPVIVALDVSDLDEAERLAAVLAPEVGARVGRRAVDVEDQRIAVLPIGVLETQLAR